jgi:hypothetical protein
MLPTAQIAHPGVARRGLEGLRRHLLAPHFDQGLASWSFSGAFVAGCALTLYGYGVAGALGQLDMGRSLGVVLFASLGTMLLVWPFLVSALIYLAAWRHGGWRSRAAGALWGATFHAAAHMGLLQLFVAEPATGITIPLVIGALWGSWLPAMAEQTSRSRFWLSPCPACGGHHEPPSSEPS